MGQGRLCTDASGLGGKVGSLPCLVDFLPFSVGAAGNLGVGREQAVWELVAPALPAGPASCHTLIFSARCAAGCDVN